MLSQLAYLAYLGAKKAKKDSSAAFYAQQARTEKAQRHKAARVNAIAQRKVARAVAKAKHAAAVQVRQDARAAQVVRHKDARQVRVDSRQAAKDTRVEDRRVRVDAANVRWHEADINRYATRMQKQADRNEANQSRVEKAAQGGPDTALEVVNTLPVQRFDDYGEINAVSRENAGQGQGWGQGGEQFDTGGGQGQGWGQGGEQFDTGGGQGQGWGQGGDQGDDTGGGIEGLAGLGAKRARCRNPAPFYGTIAKYRKACRKAGNKYDRTRCLCVDQYGRVWPLQQQPQIGPQFDPSAYLRQQEYYRQIQAQQLANQQYYLQQQQQMQPYQQPQYSAQFQQYAGQYAAPFPNAFAPGSGGATGPAFSEEAELAASAGGGGDDFGLPADAVLFQGKGPASPAAPSGAADSVTMPVQDIVNGELIVADDMAFESTPSPVAAPEQMIAPNPVTIVPAFAQPASEAAYGSYATDGEADDDGMSGLGDNKLLLIAGAAALWWFLRKK